MDHLSTGGGENDPNFWAVMLPLILLKLAWAIVLHYWPVTLAVLILTTAAIKGCCARATKRSLWNAWLNSRK